MPGTAAFLVTRDLACRNTAPDDVKHRLRGSRLNRVQRRGSYDLGWWSGSQRGSPAQCSLRGREDALKRETNWPAQGRLSEIAVLSNRGDEAVEIGCVSMKSTGKDQSRMPEFGGVNMLASPVRPRWYTRYGAKLTRWRRTQGTPDCTAAFWTHRISALGRSNFWFWHLLSALWCLNAPSPLILGTRDPLELKLQSAGKRPSAYARDSHRVSGP
jgi:hypothetical protein